MKEPFWAKKLFWMTGVLGSVLLVLMPLTASIIWPIYQPLRHPFAVVLAADATYSETFRLLTLIAYVLIMTFFMTWWRYEQSEHNTDIVKAIRLLLFAVALYALVEVGMPLSSMAAAVDNHTQLTVHDVISGIVNLGVGITLWQVGNRAIGLAQQSLGNVLRLAGVLFILFSLVSSVVFYLNWPFVGLFDQLSVDALAFGLGFAIWYFARQTHA
jgi:hypothetical protein